MADPQSNPALLLEEALRTIGAALDAHRVYQAQITVGPTGIEVHADWMYGYRRYPWADVAGLSRGHAAQRRTRPVPRPWLDPFNFTRWSVLLRVVGRLLDAQDIQSCEIEATIGPAPEISTVRAWSAGREVLDQAALAEGLTQLCLTVSARPRAAAGDHLPATCRPDQPTKPSAAPT
jgi:hypothetical protein